MDEDLELYSILLRLAVALIYGFIIFFLPALFAKKVFLKGEPSSKKRKLVILAVALSTLAIYLLLEVGLGGAIPKIKVWVNWMFIDYFFLFRTRVKKESLNTNLYSELSEYEESQKVGSSQTDSNVKSIEPSDSQGKGKGKKKVKVTNYDELYKEMDEFEERARLTKEDPSSTSEEAPCVEIPSAPITPLEEIHLEKNPTEQPTNDRVSLLSQLGNLSEDELKAVVKLASALSSIKEDKQKD